MDDVILVYYIIYHYRVVPRISDDLKVKVAKASAAVARKKNKDSSEVKKIKKDEEEKDEFDMMLDDKALNK